MDEQNKPIEFEKSLTDVGEDEVEITLTCRAQKGENHVRQLITSSRAASILDDQEEEEDEAQEQEPALEKTTSDDDDTKSSQSSKYQLLAAATSNDNSIVESPEKQKSGQTIDSIVGGLTEGVSHYLCSTNVGSLCIDDADVVKVQKQTNKSIRAGHIRNESETDSLQKMTSSGNCGSTGGPIAFGSTSLCGPRGDKRNDAQLDTFPTASRKETTGAASACNDLTFLDIRSLVAADISEMLGSSAETLSTDWMSTIRMWSASSRCCVQPRSYTTVSKRTLRNRCGHRTAQRGRLQKMWYQWHSRTAGDDGEHRRACNLSPRHTSRLPTQLWTLGVTKSQDDSDLWTDFATDEIPIADLYYDSDPEIFRHSRMADMYPKYRLPVSINTAASFGSVGVGPMPVTPVHARGLGPAFFGSVSASMSEEMDNPVDLDCFDLRDDVAVKLFLKELTLGKVTLVWHPSDSDETDDGVVAGNQSKSPVSVQGWFEMGSRLQSKVVHPKFMWRETYQPELNHRKLGMSCRTPISIDLLSIVRVLKPETLDRDKYPFAKINSSFSILSNSNDRHLFEAASPKDRDWFVHGLKLVVARLASMIIVGDEHMFVEFFSPWAHSALLDTEIDDRDVSNYSLVENESSDAQETARPLFVSTTDNDRRLLWGKKD